MLYEMIGLIATSFVLLSFMLSDIRSVRIVNIIGAALFVVYGVLIGAFSTWVLNLCLILTHIYHLCSKRE